MNLPSNENLDAYKEDVYKGLNLHQLIYSIIVLGTGTTAFLLVKYSFHVPMMLAVLVTAIITMPVAFIGFMPVCGMTVPEYLKKKRMVIENSVMIYETLPYEDNSLAGKKKRSKNHRFWKERKQQIYFDDLYSDDVRGNEQKGDER